MSITKPAELAKELFTHRGSGTLVRLGEKVRRATQWKQLNLRRLRHLIESGFGRRLTPDYFRKTKLYRAYVSEQYRAALLLTLENGIPHLDQNYTVYGEIVRGLDMVDKIAAVEKDAKDRPVSDVRMEVTILKKSEAKKLEKEMKELASKP